MFKIKKIIVPLLFLMPFFSVFAQETATVLKKGKGTEKSPYMVETKEELLYLAQSVNNGNSYENVYFELAKDIDLQCFSVNNWIPIGTESAPFKGFFNGKNFLLSGLQIDNPALDYAGLFGYVYMGKLENIRIVNSSFSAHNNVAAVVGYLMGGEVCNCYNEAAVSGNDNVGGIAGYAHSAKINACANRGTVAGKLYVGGLLGAGYGNMLVSNSYNRSDVSGYQCVGGAVGKIEGTTKKAVVKNCYQESVFCKIGVLGAATLTNVENCFYADVSGIRDFAEGTKISHKEMKTKEFAAKLSTDNAVWEKDPKLMVNSGYPILKTLVYEGVITNEATEITYQAAALNGSILPDVKGTITRKGFEIWEDGARDTARFFVLTNPLYYSVNTLKPSRLYHFRVVVITTTQTLYGDIEHFFTLPEPHKCGSDCGHPHHH
jgi:hypothetical protein